MVDYDYASGQGTLRIRDLGTVIEFWVQAGYDNFRWTNLDFNFTANGNTYPVQIDYASGANWQKVGSVTVTSSQTVYFRLLESTGTSSLAGPTTVSRYIDRGARPDPPSAVTLTNVKSTSVYATFTDGDSNGLPITTRQIAYSRTNSTSSGLTLVASDRSTQINNLKAGSVYYFWARTYNEKGWSNWGPVRSATTLDVPDPPSSVTFANVGQASVDAFFKDGSNNGAAITARQLAYNTSPSLTGATIISSDGSTTVTGLDGGRLYYFWARSANSVGWGGWSAKPASVQLLAGAWVKVGTVWKRAVPYVKVDGQWKVAEVWVFQGGFWKKAAQ